MDIKLFTVSDMRRELECNTLWKTKCVPITRQRALSQVNNPRALQDDVILLVAYDGNGEPVSYLGMLPDMMYIQGKEQRMAWGSAWWMNPDHNEGGIGALLLLRAASLYQNNFAIDSYTPGTEHLYKATRRFIPLKTLEGRSYHFQINTSLLIAEQRALRMETRRGTPSDSKSEPADPEVPRTPAARKVLKILAHSALNTSDWAMNTINRARLNPRGASLGKQLRDVRIEYLARIDSEAEEFIHSHNNQELTRRGRKELNWILAYPWILNTPMCDDNAARYYFSASARFFKIYCIKIRHNMKDLCGLLMLKIRDGTISIPYAYYTPECVDIVGATVAAHVQKLPACRLNVFDAGMIDYFERNPPPTIYRTNIKRPSLIMRKYRDTDFSKFVLQDGDGDCAFT